MTRVPVLPGKLYDKHYEQALQLRRTAASKGEQTMGQVLRTLASSRAADHGERSRGCQAGRS